MRLRPKPKKIRYRCVAMDPPWNERGGGKITRGAQRHYPLVKTKDMPEVITGSDLWLPADDAHLWMWATCNHLPDALWLMKELGFRHVTDWVWVKDKIGLGQYRRSRHEWLLFGTRGKAMVPKPAWKDSVIEAPRTRHSAKPEEAYRIMEHVSPGPRLEMFARGLARPGWSSWGDGVVPE